MKKLYGIMLLAAAFGGYSTASAYSVYVCNQNGYDQCALYGFNDGGPAYTGNWTGLQPEATTVEKENLEFYQFKFSDDATDQSFNIIFNNNIESSDDGGKQCQAKYITLSEDLYFVAANDVLTSLDDWTGEAPVGHVLYVQNTSNINPLYIYAWATGEPELFGGYPGAAPIGEVEINGVTYLKYQMAASVATYTLIFSNGKEGDEEVKVEQGFTINSGENVWISFNGQDSDASSTVSTPNITVSIANETGWENLYVYAWGESELFGDWPGEDVSEWTSTMIDGVTYYQKEFEATGDTYNFIFNNGEGQQFDWDSPITLDQDYTLNVELPAVPEENITISIANETGWENLYVYAWAEGLSELFGEWPGEDVTEWDTEVIEGVTYYQKEIPATGYSYNFIFNNGEDGDAKIQFDWNEPITLDEDYTLTVTYTSDETPNVPGTNAISSLENDEAEAVYFNLQGVRVQNPSNGLYIKVTGNKISKVLVK